VEQSAACTFRLPLIGSRVLRDSGLQRRFDGVSIVTSADIS